MDQNNPLVEYQKQCEYCGNPPGVRCESVPSNCPYRIEVPNVLDFRYVIKYDIFDNSYPHWSRKWEYPLVKQICRRLLSDTKNPKMHNSSWGFDTEHHKRFKTELENEYGVFNVLSTDILSSEEINTEVYNVLMSPPNSYLNAFDCVFNISAIEEISGDHVTIVKNLFSQVKPGGFLIITFDLPGMQLSKLEEWLGQSISKDNFNDRIIGHGQWFEGLNVGLLVLKK
jgi:hypothetical protein